MEPLSDPLIMNGSARAHNTRNSHAAVLAGDVRSSPEEKRTRESAAVLTLKRWIMLTQLYKPTR